MRAYLLHQVRLVIESKLVNLSSPRKCSEKQFTTLWIEQLQNIPIPPWASLSDTFTIFDDLCFEMEMKSLNSFVAESLYFLGSLII